MITREEFEPHRLEILSKTSGSNIHYIHGRIGLILTSFSLLDKYSDTLGEEKIEYYKKLIPECIKEINIKLNDNTKRKS